MLLNKGHFQCIRWKLSKKFFQFQLQSTISGYKSEKRKRESELSVSKQRKYNLPFKLSELKNSLDRSKDTTAGPDDIHYQILKHLPSDALETLLNIMNEIWRTGTFPENWPPRATRGVEIGGCFALVAGG